MKTFEEIYRLSEVNEDDYDAIQWEDIQEKKGYIFLYRGNGTIPIDRDTLGNYPSDIPKYWATNEEDGRSAMDWNSVDHVYKTQVPNNSIYYDDGEDGYDDISPTRLTKLLRQCRKNKIPLLALPYGRGEEVIPTFTEGVDWDRVPQKIKDFYIKYLIKMPEERIVGNLEAYKAEMIEFEKKLTQKKLPKSIIKLEQGTKCKDDNGETFTIIDIKAEYPDQILYNILLDRSPMEAGYGNSDSLNEIKMDWQIKKISRDTNEII